MVSTGSFKIVTLGEVGVGKTSLINRFHSNSFSKKRTSTEDMGSVDKKIVVDSQDVILTIWDTVGQERFRVVAPNYYRGAVGAVLVYDITEKSSFDAVVRWVNELSMQGEENVQMIIVGNKFDLESERQLPEQTALDYAKLIGAPHFHVSAKTGDYVDDAFRKLGKMILDMQKGRLNRRRTTRKDRGVSIDRRVSDVNNKSKCCG